MSRPAAPLLRAPPFPGVKPEIAAISGLGPDAQPYADLDALVAAIRAARVGGSFWAPPPSLVEGAVIVRATTRREADHAVATQDQAKLALILPDRRWARRFAGKRVAMAIGEIDPWPLLETGAKLLARPGDEWHALAAIVGLPSATLGGTPLPPPDLHAALLDGLVYRDCYRGGLIDPLVAVAQLAFWRRLLDANRDYAVAAGISWWKRDQIARFLWAGRATPLAFLDRTAKAVAAAKQAGGGIAVWPAREPEALTDAATAAGVPVARIEDGFIRSIGLGANFHLPYSITLDAKGVYFDPSRPSDLETILATAPFPPALTARAERLIARVVAAGISKYGVTGAPVDLPEPSGRRLVLVTGQVEDDLSVMRGGGAVRSNLDLLRRAREAEPDAEIWFRPHPDVDAGHRVGRIPDAVALDYADHVVRAGTAIESIERADAVHVLTSLAGFEALLRGKPVIVHGQPFYAGWGLTTDCAPPIARRTRRLTLAELVAGTLILYPRYLDPATGLPCPAEILLDRLASQTRPKMTPLIRLRTLQGKLAKRFTR